MEWDQRPKPVDSRKSEYNRKNNDAIMEDISNIKHMKHKMYPPGKPQDKARHQDDTPTTHQTPERTMRQSKVSAQVKTIGVLNQVLNTHIDLVIGEVLRILKDLSALTPIAPITTSFFTKSHRLLIQLHMQCDGRPITAIIDTGSQLNIVNKNICDTKIVRPVDSKDKISIADANGGQGKLEGMVKDVPLNCGAVTTQADLYVCTHIPFELLLGRPGKGEITYQLMKE